MSLDEEGSKIPDWWKKALETDLFKNIPTGIPEDWDPDAAGSKWALKTMEMRENKSKDMLGFDAGALSKGQLWAARQMQKRVEESGSVEGSKGAIWAAKQEAKQAGDPDNWKNYIRKYGDDGTSEYVSSNPPKDLAATAAIIGGGAGNTAPVVINNVTNSSPTSVSSSSPTTNLNIKAGINDPHTSKQPNHMHNARRY
jgi:hypothetical protein